MDSHRNSADTTTAVSPKQADAGSATSPRVALTIVSHPSPTRAGERLVLRALHAGRAIQLSRAAPDFLAPGHALGTPLGDPFISRRPLHLEPLSDGGLQLRIEAGGTAVRVGGSPAQGTIALDLESLRRGAVLTLADRVVLLAHLVPFEEEAPQPALGMVGTGLGSLRADIARLGDLDVPVLIRGETGTGKELVARALHDQSARRGNPFVSVNLGAIPKELAASELFGAHKGAYTGATRDRDGFFRAARGGTLFLDEVGEAPPEVQVMLLRVLESGDFHPVGSQIAVKSDARLLAATDADLETRIRAGSFKAPLLHRLAGYEIRLPPLRERREDIGSLALHFARQELAATGEEQRLIPAHPKAEPWLPADLAERLVSYHWPGNVRQLRNVMRQMVIGSRGLPRLRLDPRLLEVESVVTPSEAGAVVPSVEPPKRGAGVARRKPSQVTEEELVEALRLHQWDLQAAADQLGISRSSMYDLIDGCAAIRTAGAVSADEIAASFQESGGDLDAMVSRLQVSKRALKRRLKEIGLLSGA